MGCDIHDCLQIKEDGIWKSVAWELFAGRQYTLFGVLSSVRGPPHSDFTETRYLPEDTNSFEIQGDGDFVDTAAPDGPYWMGDHSHTWYTISEIRKALALLPTDINFMYILEAAEPYLSRLTPDNIRYVCGFDS